MKKIGLIFALKEELDATIKEFEIKEEIKISNLVIYKCSFSNLECFLIESGIGKVNAGRVAQVLIDILKVEYIFNVGVAGSISANVKIGDIVIGEKCVQHDFDLTSFNRKKGEIPDIGIYIESDRNLLEVAKKINTNHKKHIGVIASGDVFVSGKEKGLEIEKEFNALCVEMEGAAIAQVCHLNQIPFLVIRAISDSIDNENNSIVYDEFLKSSSEEVAVFIKEILKLI